MISEPTEGTPAFRLHDDELLRLWTRVDGAVIGVTDRRIIVQDEAGDATELPLGHISRVSLSVERAGPGVLVFFPSDLALQPHVMSVPRGQMQSTGRLVGYIGDLLEQHEPAR